MSIPDHHVNWVASGLRRAAASCGVTLPDSYARAVTADGLERADSLAVTRLGAGVVIHTRPDDNRCLPVLLGYADGRGQWYRDGTRHQPTGPAGPVAAPTAEVGL